MRLIPILAFLSFVPFTLHAQDMPNILTMPSGEALLHISATEQQDVAQDLLISNLRYETQNNESAQVQNEINTAMKDALSMAETFKSVKVETRQYNIHKTTIPRTKEQVWRGSQGLTIKSTDAESVLNLTGKLQEHGFIASNLSYAISPKRAADIKDNMMEAALVKLQARAQRAAKALGKTTAELVEVNVQGGHVPSPVSMYRGVHMEMASMKSDMAPPVASPGETTLSLSVSAKAVLKP